MSLKFTVEFNDRKEKEELYTSTRYVQLIWIKQLLQSALKITGSCKIGKKLI